jgi:hypothetical protein
MYTDKGPMKRNMKRPSDIESGSGRIVLDRAESFLQWQRAEFVEKSCGTHGLLLKDLFPVTENLVF